MSILNRFTLKSLRANKMRTLVTIIGIILSVAMITAVTTLVTSLQNYMLESITRIDGDWHGVVFGVGSDKLDSLSESEEVERVASLQSIGYAELDRARNEYKPYLFIGGMDEGFETSMPINLADGRLPENETELILPKHLKTNGGVEYAIGDVLKLDIGARTQDGVTLYQNTGFQTAADDVEQEVFTASEKRTYTVVGFYERPSFEDYSAPGYTALTVKEDNSALVSDVYIRLYKAGNIFKFVAGSFADYSASYNMDYLRMQGASSEGSYDSVLYGLAVILIAIIMLASISLIYNAFSISLSERKKQVGLLSSIGATRKQLTGSVLFEALVLCSVGVPLGILAGIAGIGVTLKCTSGMFSQIMSGAKDVEFTLSVSALAIVAAAVIGVVTVLISALIPARRAVRVSAIDAIRQTNDVKISGKSVKTGKLTYKLFGFSGMIASKNFKRNRRKYRATVVSLFVSVVLFISASSFCVYLGQSVEDVIDYAAYDISYYTNFKDGESKYTPDQLYKKLSAISGINDGSYTTVEFNGLEIDEKSINSDYIRYYEEINGDDCFKKRDGLIKMEVETCFMNDEKYESWLKENGFDKSDFISEDKISAAALDFFKSYNTDENRYYTFDLMATDSANVELLLKKQIEGYTLSEIFENDDGETMYRYTNDEDSKAEDKLLTESEATVKHVSSIAAVINDAPIGIDSLQGSRLILVYPYSVMDKVIGEQNENLVYMFFKSDTPNEVFERMGTELDELGITDTENIYNLSDSISSQRAVIGIISVFSYGFIILISLISAANVFNTISTNIALRRREFAVLRSTGMGSKDMNRMMNYECLLYGAKGLMYGIPVAIGVTYLIYKSINNGIAMNFFIPYNSVIIAVLSVFAVVFATMLYSMSKIKKENTIDALKNENL